MAGKRLLDAAKLFNTGRAVGKQHLGLRRQQWEVYTETSSLAKAVKTQTDRVTVTAGAAWELAKRFSESDRPPWQGNGAETAKERVGQDVMRQQTEMSKRQQEDAVAAGRVEQDDGTLSSLRKRELQRQAEDQIPAAGAVAQDTSAGQDTFSQRTENMAPGLSSLPRMKMPKHNADGQESEQQGLNQDVFYTASEHASKDEVPDGINTDVYSSPKVARMLGQTAQDRPNPYAGRQRAPPKPLPEMVAAQRAKEEVRHDTPQASPTSGATQAPSGGQTEMENLAASIAHDAQAEPTPPTGAGDETAKVPYEMRESRVPSSRFGRFWQYSGLATSMAFGAVGEGFRRFTGGGAEGSLMLSEGNMNRLVAKLSRMRGAALKLGQMMSFQDSKVLPPTINTVLQRVQDSADYMPPSQRNQVLERNLGENWRDLFSNFEEKPFAAASIGQVHKATLASNGKDVAVKVQYPGVRNSIDSDLNNLSLLLTASRLLPKGLFLDKTIANARTELGWECDYEREAKACIRFRELLVDEGQVFAVPEVYTEASGMDVLTAEFLTGTAVTKIKDLTQDERDWIGTQILRLALRELMEWRFMQTDPNWTNFLYHRESKKLQLLDFGASRDFPDSFIEPYVSLLIAASKGDREACRDLSVELGYLTGREGKAMLDAHVDSILVLAEPFVETAPDIYNFEDQTITDRVRANIGLMLRERQAPPPEETYSLHRKLSGAFLLCARLRSRIRTRDMFANAVRVWERRERKVKADTVV